MGGHGGFGGRRRLARRQHGRRRLLARWRHGWRRLARWRRLHGCGSHGGHLHGCCGYFYPFFGFGLALALRYPWYSLGDPYGYMRPCYGYGYYGYPGDDGGCGYPYDGYGPNGYFRRRLCCAVGLRPLGLERRRAEPVPVGANCAAPAPQAAPYGPPPPYAAPAPYAPAPAPRGLTQGG